MQKIKKRRNLEAVYTRNLSNLKNIINKIDGNISL